MKRNGNGSCRRQNYKYCPTSRMSNTYIANGKSTKEEIIAAAKAANAHNFIMNLAEGYNTKLGDRGVNISGGQRQRVSIARALIRDPKVIVLDEATSALDVETERELLRNIMKDEYPRTCIVTTHRPTVLSMCDKVYGIREKKCVELTEAEIKKIIENF